MSGALVGMSIMVVAVGCGGTPNCEDAVKSAAKKIPALAESTTMSRIVAECIQDNWSEETRACIAKARDEPDVVACAMRAGGATAKTARLGESKLEIAKLAEIDMVNTAFPVWATRHADKGCPDKLEDLSDYMDKKNTNDPWGHPYKMFCGQNLPAGAKGSFAVASAGADGEFGTSDDIKSWE